MSYKELMVVSPLKVNLDFIGSHSMCEVILKGLVSLSNLVKLGVGF